MIVIESFWRGAQWKLESYQWKHLRVSRFGAHTASCARECAAQYGGGAAPAPGNVIEDGRTLLK
jgi:hypothetical protein